MIKDDSVFFIYYLLALKKALQSDGNNCKDASWFYPKEISLEMDRHEDIIYNKYPIIDMVYVYFDAKCHGYDSINSGASMISIEVYRERVIQWMKITAKLFKIDFTFES